MSFETVCSICESRPASHTCDQCGAQVCSEHFDRELGACSQCAASIRGGGADDASPDSVDPSDRMR